MINGGSNNKIDQQIYIINNAICRFIDTINISSRGIASQGILKELRDLVEHTMLKVYSLQHDNVIEYRDIKNAITYAKKQGGLHFLWRFHDYLQISVSHYTLDPDNSERIMLKYYEYILRIKKFLKKEYNIDILQYIEKFPLNLDNNTREYYEKISSKINSSGNINNSKNDRYYIHKIKPFFINQEIYYEVTFFPANGKADKFERIIGFTKIDISRYYAVKLWTVKDNITVLDKTLSIYIIIKYEVSIRPCEIEKISQIIGNPLTNQTSTLEYRGIMNYLTNSGLTIVELLRFSNDVYDKIKDEILTSVSAKSTHIFELFQSCRNIIINEKPGHNILLYLLLHLNNEVMKYQMNWEKNPKLSSLFLEYGCIPFDKMPFNTSLVKHNPKLEDIFDCIPINGREHELLARIIRNNTERNGQLYTSSKDIKGFNNIDELIKKYNSKLYSNSNHQARKINKFKDNLFIQSYEDDTIIIINKIIELSKKGIKNYYDYVREWVNSNVYVIDCKEKKEAILKMFINSSVSLIYGSAGTGKSTMINHISNLFSKEKKLYLANTNPAVENLKRKVNAGNCTFATISKFLLGNGLSFKYDIIVIDECSTVSNIDMRRILEKVDLNLLVLVGDIYQIESIQFGNWFSAVRGFISSDSVCELTTPYRSNNRELIILWDRVRTMEDTLQEHIVRNNYSSILDASIFDNTKEDEIILCLNYDGLYGINNINHFLQESNMHNPFMWGLQVYKVGDPILFNECERFAPLIYNNLKGKIVDIILLPNKIKFTIEVDIVITSLDANRYSFDLLKSQNKGKSIISFTVDEYKSLDEENDAEISSIVPFQLSYAISIHKAQGLEYSSVKIIISNDVEELITHDIFYTAVTRARDMLKIYWTPETQNKVLSTIKPKINNKDIIILKQKIH